LSDPLVFRPQVEKADIDCSNGIIHVIDTVMIPDVKYCGV